jgi:hypothetical protein
MSSATLPELNRRLIEKRGAFVDTAAALRGRVKREAQNLAPQRIIKRHPETVLGTALVVGFIAGRIAGAVVRAFVR